VPATVMVTAFVVEANGSAPVAEVDGSVPTSSRSGSGEVDGLQMDTVSVQQYRYLMTLRFPFAHNLMNLRDRRQSFGQLHEWSGGVVPSRLPLGFPLRQGAPAFSGLAAEWTRCRAEPQLLEPSSLRLRCWGEGGPVEGCRVVEGSSGTILCVPAEGFQLAVAEQQNLSSTKSSQILTGF
jgi:hypothetical protein